MKMMSPLSFKSLINISSEQIYVCCNAKIGTRNHNQSIAQFICDAKISQS